jgi:hypothetical protein
LHEINNTETKKQPAKIAKPQVTRRGRNQIEAHDEQAGDRSIRGRKENAKKGKRRGEDFGEREQARHGV